MKMTTKEVIEILDFKYRERVKKETGHSYAGEITDTSRLYQSISLFKIQIEENMTLNHKINFATAKIDVALQKMQN